MDPRARLRGRRPIRAKPAQEPHLHWVDLYTGPITWQIRDQAGLLSTLELLTRVHRTATAVFLDGDEYRADPTSPDYGAT
jgi:hypothetical protein